jgi:hypothetical protein
MAIPCPTVSANGTAKLARSIMGEIARSIQRVFRPGAIPDGQVIDQDAEGNPDAGQ